MTIRDYADQAFRRWPVLRTRPYRITRLCDRLGVCECGPGDADGGFPLYNRSILNSVMSAEMIEEVVRILVGSAGLVLAIPITTGIAVAVANTVVVPSEQHTESTVLQSQ